MKPIKTIAWRGRRSRMLAKTLEAQQLATYCQVQRMWMELLANDPSLRLSGHAEGGYASGPNTPRSSSDSDRTEGQP
jgi:hypothetical protein